METEHPPLQDLAAYRLPSSWAPGGSAIQRIIWFVFGAPLLANRWIPGSGWRYFLLSVFGARLGSRLRIKPGLRVKYPWNLHVGNDCWLGEDAWVDNLASVTLGDRVVLSQGVYLCTGNHNFRDPSFALNVQPIELASDVWVAAKAVVAPGTVIGYGAVVGLASVVSGVIAPRSVVSGNPARVKGFR